MPANAAFIRLPRAALAELVSAAGEEEPQSFQDFLAANGTSVVEFDEDAEIFSVLLPVLADDYDIDLETSENEVVADLAEATETLVVILTQDDQRKYQEPLSPENFTEEELAEAHADFLEEEEEGAGSAMLAGVAALHQALQEVDADHVVILTVG